ncbi:MAG TPA: hypothetical protein VFL56_05435 [Solirubrobacterales bacterium]|nr:hypothetical protein [Solirubrobacterales bacterium]
MTRIRAAAVFPLALVAAIAIAACGGGEDGGGEEDPQQVLRETFARSIESGVFDFDVRVESSGGGDPGSFEAKAGGPFQGQGERFPQFDLDVSLKAESGSQSISGSGGLTSTGEAAFVNFQGTEYAVDQELFDQYVSAYTALQERGDPGMDGLLGTLGITPTDWLTDLENQGTEDVEGIETVRITGRADVSKLVEDLKRIAESTGRAAGGVDPARFDQLEQTIQGAEFEVFSGEEDKLLRRLEGTLELDPGEAIPGAPDSVEVDFELTIASVNEPQTVEAPSDAEPLSALFRSLGVDPGRLGKSLRGGLQSGGAPPETGDTTTAPSQDAIEKYQRCLSEAEGQSELQECAAVLGE